MLLAQQRLTAPAPDFMPNRVYTEQEIAQILQRAIERQEAETKQHQARAHGLDLNELERLGSEVGIAPEHLRAAALEVHRSGVQGNTELTGTHNVVERLIPGALTETLWGEIVSELRHQLGGEDNDRISTIGTMHEWSAANAWGVQTKATLSQRGDRVAVRLAQRVNIITPTFDSLFYSLGFAFLPALLYGEAQNFSFLQGVMLFAALGVLLSGLSYVFMTRWREKKHRQLEAVGDRLEAVINAHSSTDATATALPTATASRIELSHQDALDTPTPTSAPRTRA